LVPEPVRDDARISTGFTCSNHIYRRAKIKNLAKKSLETGEDIDSIPESMRAYLAMQAMESGKGLNGSYFGRTGLSPFGASSMLLGDPNSKVCTYTPMEKQGKRHTVLTFAVINHLTCRSLSIGKWTRVGQNAMDLVVFYSPDKGTITYYINNDQAGYKIEYPFSYVKNIYLENTEGDPSKMGGIVIELTRPPHFLMDHSNAAAGFNPVGDFTEDQQATHCLVHHLGGNPKVMSGQLAKLVSLETFMNRHNPHGMHAPHGFHDPHAALSMSAPVSPTARPSSQPNFHQPHVGMFQEHWGVSPMHSSMRPPQGHKRQRSRSVPGPIDFAMFQNQPMPSFYIQPPGEMGPPQHNPNIYAPIPQQPGPVNPNLRIDTQAGFGLEMRQYPMSATTAPSPAEFPPSPGFFPGHDAQQMPTPGYNPAFNQGFLSPMPNADAQGHVSVSPMPFTAPSEPSIVEQSPPMAMMGRPGSVDLYSGNDGSCAVSEDGTTLNEMYSKHTINLPMHSHSPGYVQSQQAELDMDQLVQFDTIDPASLSPEIKPSMS
jgi:hypothetical protein